MIGGEGTLNLENPGKIQYSGIILSPSGILINRLALSPKRTE